MLFTLKRVFARPLYIGLSMLVGFLIFTASTILIPNWSLLVQIVSSASMSLLDKLTIILQLYGSITTNFTVFSASVTLLLSLLVGINLALFVYAVKQRAGSWASSTTSIGGLAGGLFGVGCAACGSLVVTAVLPGVLGAAVTTLPFGGEEIGVIGLVLVGVSIYYLVQDITTPSGTCSV